MWLDLSKAWQTYVFYRLMGTGLGTVSISHGNRLPLWDDICLARNIFWYDSECVIQYIQERKSNVMHLWRPIKADIPVPPKILV
ncbi:MAG: hypothetical protein NC177_14235 [Ruminococcus flavefaciens]|nr:hypothetical protein [Ruminococcus flavefaciens]